jgi:hypothetical protein
MLSVLLAVAALRPTPDAANVAVILYAAGGALEIGGVLTIGIDLSAARRQARVYAEQQRIISLRGFGVRSRTGTGIITVTGGHEPTFEQRLEAVEEHQRGEPRRISDTIDSLRQEIQQHVAREVSATDRQARHKDQELAELVGAAGPSPAAWAGFVALFLGVLVGTAGNLVSALAR